MFADLFYMLCIYEVFDNFITFNLDKLIYMINQITEDRLMIEWKE